MLLNKHFVYSGDDDIVGRLSKDDGEGRNENKGRLKSDFGFFQYLSRLFRFTLSHAGELSWSWVPKNNTQVHKEKENFVLACLLPPLNVKSGILTS